MISIRSATIDDNKALQELQKFATYGDGNTISAVNQPDYFWRTAVTDESKVYVAYSDLTREVLGSSSCAIKNLYINGEVVRVGYSWNYYTSPSHRRKGIANALLHHVENTFAMQNACLSYVYISKQNMASRQLFENVGYYKHQELCTRYRLVYKRAAKKHNATIRTMSRNDVQMVADLINRTWAGYDFSWSFTADSLVDFIRRIAGLSLDDIYLLERNGKITACVGCWERGQVINTQIQSLDSKMLFASAALDVLRMLIPVPRILKPGESMKQYRLVPVGFEEPSDLSSLLSTINNRALTANIYTLSGTANELHPLVQSLSGIFKLDLSLLLYVKSLDGHTKLADNPVYVDALDL